jgi:hypothetical protein
MKAKLKALEERYISATTDQEIDAVREEMSALCDLDAVAVANAALINLRQTNEELEFLRPSRNNFIFSSIIHKQPRI